MITYLIISLFIGLVIGLFALIPNMHINNILPIFDSLSINLIVKGTSVIVGSILFTMLSYIVVFFLQVPNADNYVLSSSYEYYRKGKSYYAIYLSAIGSLYVFLLSLPILLLFIIVSKQLQAIILYITIPMLFVTFLFLIVSVKNIYGYLIIIFSIILGMIVLNGSISVINPMLCLIGGFYAVSSLYTLYLSKQNKYVQMISYPKISFSKMLHISLISMPLSIIATLFAGLGSGVASYFGSKISKLDDDGYILLNSSISLMVTILSFFAAVNLGIVRTGSSYYFLDYSKGLFTSSNIYIFIVVFIALVISSILTLLLSKIIIKYYQNSDNKSMLIISSLITAIILLIFSNIIGIVVFLISGLIGILCVRSNNPKIIMMCSIIIPVLFFYLL